MLGQNNQNYSITKEYIEGFEQSKYIVRLYGKYDSYHDTKQFADIRIEKLKKDNGDV